MHFTRESSVDKGEFVLFESFKSSGSTCLPVRWWNASRIYQVPQLALAENMLLYAVDDGKLCVCGLFGKMNC